jgi:hypothetical protein
MSSQSKPVSSSEWKAVRAQAQALAKKAQKAQTPPAKR